MSSSTDDVFSFLSEQLVIGTSIAATIPGLPNQVTATVKWASGGTLFILGGTFLVGASIYGSTYAVANKYVIGVAEAFSAQLRGSIILGAEGATVTCYLTRGMSTEVR